MILKDVRDYVRDRGLASVSDIALHFKAEPDTVRAMLLIWLRKGQVSRLAATSGCGSGCHQCAPAETEVYAWNQDVSHPSLTQSGSCPRVDR